jgi:hypothetical protein
MIEFLAGTGVRVGELLQLWVMDQGFAIQGHTLSLEGDILHVTTFTHSTDNSGRADYTNTPPSASH